MRKTKNKNHKNRYVQLAKAYYDLGKPEGYAGAPKVKSKYVNTTEFLKAQPAYTLHKPMRRRILTRKYKVSSPNELWQMDLMEMIPYAKINKGNRYILTCIDVYTRFARALPLKAKDGKSVAEAVSKMFKKEKPRYIQTDLGKEFYNTHVKNVFKKFNIAKHYTVHSQYKAPHVERFNRTLREKLNRYFTHRGHKTWIHVLAKIIKTYNNTPHSSLFFEKPKDIDGNIAFWEKQEAKLPRKLPKSKKKLRIGSCVRLSRIGANPFRKNFDQNWSEEVFRIHSIDTRDRPTMYTIKDNNGEIVEGKCYAEELQVVAKPKTYRIEKVIRTRGRGKYKQYLVKWYGYDNTHNSWISHQQFSKHYD